MNFYLMWNWRARLLGLFIILSLNSCSTSIKNSPTLLHQILLYNLHFRRPETLGADPKAEKGEQFYETYPKPNERFDCESASAFFQNVQIASLRECLISLNRDEDHPTVKYLLVRDPAPYFKIVVPKDSDQETHTPSCLEKTLPMIPVAREIFFQSSERNQLECYSSRLSIREDETLGLRSYFHDVKLNIQFPLPHSFKSDQDVLMLLVTWSVTPFFEKNQNTLVSTRVPESICRKCMGERNQFTPAVPLPPHWPQE